MVTQRTLSKLKAAISDFRSEAADDPKFQGKLADVGAVLAVLDAKDGDEKPADKKDDGKDAVKSPGEAFAKASEAARAAFKASKAGATD